MVLTICTIADGFIGGERMGSQTACSAFILQDRKKAAGPPRFWPSDEQVNCGRGW